MKLAFLPILAATLLSAPTFAAPKPIIGAQDVCLISVRSYFNRLPRSFFGGYDQKGLLKPYSGAVVDERLRYISVTTSGGSEDDLQYQVTVFRYGGVDTVAAARNEVGNNLSLRFFQQKQGRMVDVTKRVLPTDMREAFHAELPRRGSTIVISSGDMGNPVTFYLDWKRGRFVRRAA